MGSFPKALTKLFFFSPLHESFTTEKFLPDTILIFWESIHSIHSAISIILLELVDYIQHYGLERSKKEGKYEIYGEQHSWNSRHASANWSTFNLGLHSEHHITASKHYPLLSQQQKIMEMPANYPLMIMMALLPPIWFKVMNAKLMNK